MNRDSAWQVVTEYVKEPGLRRHMLAVEAAMRFYAGELSGDQDLWGLAGLLHDFDWEVHPDLQRHPAEGASILRDQGCGEAVIRCILSHSTAYTGVAREQPMDYALLACDEITGLIVATALVRPSKDIREVQVSSVKKKWKDRAFAAGVDRNHVEQAAAEFGAACYGGKLEFMTHVGNVLAAMQGVAASLDLDGRLVR